MISIYIRSTNQMMISPSSGKGQGNTRLGDPYLSRMSVYPLRSRRDFLKDLSLGGLALWLGADAWGAAGDPLGAPTTTRKGILRLHLQGTSLPEMKRFYGEVLGFAVEGGEATLRVEAGGTRLRFDPAVSGAPHYHIAWAIPEHKFALAKAWLAARTPLLKTPEGRDEFRFRGVNRTACYFADPAGNVLELIARHNLKDAAKGPFTLRDILYVNHVGLVVDDMQAAIDEIRAGLDLELRREPAPNFAQLGDEHRHVVLVTRQRLWLPEWRQAADVYPVEAVLHGAAPRTLTFARYPYRIALEG